MSTPPPGRACIVITLPVAAPPSGTTHASELEGSAAHVGGATRAATKHERAAARSSRSGKRVFAPPVLQIDIPAVLCGLVDTVTAILRRTGLGAGRPRHRLFARLALRRWIGVRRVGHPVARLTDAAAAHALGEPGAAAALNQSQGVRRVRAVGAGGRTLRRGDRVAASD